MGESVMPMLINVAGTCGIRIMWVFTVFAHVERTMTCLFLAYPLSWAATSLVLVLYYFFAKKRLLQQADAV